MKENGYLRLYDRIHKKGLERTLTVLNKAVTAAVFVFYPLFLAILYINNYSKILKMILVPAAAFCLITVLRLIINAPRPYEVMNTKPLTGVNKSGKSFPSRHAFSCFMIAFCCFDVNPFLGTVMIITAFALAVLRVLCGVHFIKDVAAGGIFALAAYFIGFIII